MVLRALQKSVSLGSSCKILTCGMCPPWAAEGCGGGLWPQAQVMLQRLSDANALGTWCSWSWPFNLQIALKTSAGYQSMVEPRSVPGLRSIHAPPAELHLPGTLAVVVPVPSRGSSS